MMKTWGNRPSAAYESEVRATAGADICAGDVPDTTGTDRSIDDAPLTVVKVFYATCRNRLPDAAGAEVFGTQRGQLAYGRASVSIPREHTMARLESPRWYKLEFRPNPEKHVVLIGTLAFADERAFCESIRRDFRQDTLPEAFVFVHGYYVTFADAIRRTAQLKYDLGFDGPAVAFSWPSLGQATGYVTDANNADAAAADLAEVLTAVTQKTGAQRVHIIAHSMGSRVLAGAVRLLGEPTPDQPKRIGELVLAAPDIDADLFRRQASKAFAAHATHVTLYASSQDMALSLSRSIQGGYARAGESGDGLIVVPPIETIDATNADTSLIGHSYYGDCGSIVSDLFLIFRYGFRPDGRNLPPQTCAAGKYWKMR